MVIEEKLATKDDLHLLERHLEKRIDEGDKFLGERINEMDKRLLRLENSIESLTLKLTVRLGGVMVAGMIVLGTLIKL